MNLSSIISIYIVGGEYKLVKCDDIKEAFDGLYNSISCTTDRITSYDIAFEKFKVLVSKNSFIKQSHVETIREIEEVIERNQNKKEFEDKAKTLMCIIDNLKKEDEEKHRYISLESELIFKIFDLESNRDEVIDNILR